MAGDPHRVWGGGAACCKHGAARGPSRHDWDAERSAAAANDEDGRATICDADAAPCTEEADAVDGRENGADDDVEDRLIALWQAGQ